MPLGHGGPLPVGVRVGYSAAMAEKTESELVVDLRGQSIGTLDDFWDAVTEPCGLREWFGRNTDA